MRGYRDYEIEIYDPLRGTRLAYLGAFETLQYARKTNDYGKLILSIAVRALPPSLIGYLNRIQVDLAIAVKYLGKLEMDTIWFVRNVRVNSFTATFEAFDAMELLDRRIIQYAVGTAQSLKTAPADDMLKAYVRENLGSLAIAARQIAGFAVEPDLSLAPSTTKEAGWDLLLPALQEVAQDSAQQAAPVFLAFDIVAASLTSLEFRTYIGQRGMDRRPSSSTPGQRFGPQYGNVVDWEVSYNTKDEITHATAGGQGEGTDRSVDGYGDTARMAASPFNRREVFVDCRNIKDASQLQPEARSAVRAGRPRAVLTGQIQQTRDTLYSVHFAWGDYLSVETPYDSFDCRLDSMSITIEGGKRTIDAKIWAENA